MLKTISIKRSDVEFTEVIKIVYNLKCMLSFVRLGYSTLLDMIDKKKLCLQFIYVNTIMPFLFNFYKSYVSSRYGSLRNF